MYIQSFHSTKEVVNIWQ